MRQFGNDFEKREGGYIMMTWNHFLPFAIVASALWTVGTIAALLHKAGRSSVCLWATAAGLVVYSAFIAGLWMSLGRPPLRTLGETRLWYSFFMVISCMAVYARWHYRWLPLTSQFVAMVFIVINIACPDIHDRSLMPALQSAWFIPHVTIYMFSYSIFGCAFLLAVAGLTMKTNRYLATCDSLVRIGIAFLTLGMLSGCLWAKQAWGSYWSWDPKETWAATTWAVYLGYVHHRLRSSSLITLWWLIAGFLLLQMCWYGVNFLPTASQSMHSY